MIKPTQHATDSDFLDGIDDKFLRLMKLYGNGKRSRRSNAKSSEDRLVLEIVDNLYALSTAQKEKVLTYAQSLKPKVE